MRPDEQTPEEIYQDFWREIVEKPDGSLDVEQVKKELADYHGLLHNVPLVYSEVTGGRVSKPNTTAFAVIGEFNSHVEQLIAEALADEQEAREEL